LHARSLFVIAINIAISRSWSRHDAQVMQRQRQLADPVDWNSICKRLSMTSSIRRRRAGRPPAGARHGEKVRDYPQLSIRVPNEFKCRLNAMSAVTGQAQWRVVVGAINCFFDALSETDRELVDGLSQRLMSATE
jgi:predicted DNA-binding protein